MERFSIFYLLEIMVLLFGIMGLLVASSKFSLGAKKIKKNNLLWSCLGMFSYLVPFVVVNIPIIYLALAYRQGVSIEIWVLDFSTPLFSLFLVLAVILSVVVSKFVYRKYLTQGAANDENEFAFCAECGTKCRASAAFCAKCGNSMKQG